ncbi:MAG: DUF4245 family protein [Leucobacter sp.]
MARNNKPPRVVAELGRPETSAETAARKAKDSHLYRQRKTVNNLVFSLLVSLAVVLVIVLVVPRGSGDFAEHSVDVQELSTQASPVQGYDLIAPDVPDGWLAKQAELRYSEADEVTFWYVGYTTADQHYAAVVQAFTNDGSSVPDTWIAEQLERQSATGTEQIAGSTWTQYDHPERDPDESNLTYGLHGETEGGTILVYGTDTPDVLRTFAEQVAAQAAQAKQPATEEASE